MPTVADVVGRHLDPLLRGIRNKPPGREYSFFLPERIGVRCWIADRTPFLTCALDLMESRPALGERYAPEELADAIIRVIHDHVHHFEATPFFLWPLAEPQSLADCATAEATDRLRGALTRFASAEERHLFVFPWLNRQPADDVIADRFVWIRPSCRPETLEASLGVDLRFADFSRWPPSKSARPAPPFPADGSLVGLMADGWRDGVARLRALAGALCVALPKHDALARVAAAPPAAVVAVDRHGAIALRDIGPIAPRLAGPRTMPADYTARVRRLLVQRSTPEAERRFRTALSFVSTGWLSSGTMAFANYFIAVDALYGERNEVSRRIQHAVAARIDDPAWRAGDRIRELLGMRHEVLHGRASSLAGTSRFIQYFREYGSHPLDDLFRIVRDCLAGDATT